MIWNSTTIKRLRDSLGLTKTEFARRLGVSSMAVHHWEENNVIPSGLSIKALNKASRRKTIRDFLR